LLGSGLGNALGADGNMKHLSILATCLLLALAPRTAVAREASGKFKGAIGGGLLGAEVVLLTESAFRLKSSWAYLAGGVGGAALGTVGGYYLVEKDRGPHGPIYLLAGSLALVIPTLLAVLSASQFEPPTSYRQDLPADGEPALEPAPEGEGARRELVPSRARTARGVERDATPVALQLPSFVLSPTFSDVELSTFAVSQRTELHVYVLNGVF
jgi:hypothetical protein